MTDSRYEKQFQRGYAGPPVPPRVQASGSTPEQVASGRPHHDDRVDPVPTGGEQTVGEEFHGEGAGADRPREIGTARSFRRNPFAIGLLAVGVLLLIVGVWLVQQSSVVSSIVVTPEQQAVVQIESQLANPLLIGGVIAIIAWLVMGVFAASAERRGD